MEPVANPGFRTEFVHFLQTYNIFGVAIGLLIATKVSAFSKTMIEDLITPIFFAPVLKRLKINKLEDLSHKGIRYGKVIAISIDFLITVLFVFLLVRYLSIKIK